MTTVSKKILVVDDEEAIRQVVKMELVTLGYDPECAQNGKEALEILARDGGCQESCHLIHSLGRLF